ncbi:MAG: ribulose-phosphate 3-epimerase [Clostridia bacterium]|nr:ribulose-phosphate 3-epimerase [Clostridia bacterium]
MVEISTSILTVSKDQIVKTIYNLEVAKTNYFHIDVMDGKFVENFTNEVMEEYCGYIKSISNIPLDVHLMVKNIKKYIDIYLNYEPNIITFHIEAVKNKEEALELIKYIKSNNCKVGIAINPKTKISKLHDVLDYIHMVTVMTVEPGKGGQNIIKEAIQKIKELKDYIDANNIDIDISADGGIKLENVEDVKSAGANIIVSGSGIINSNKYEDVISKMKI